MSFRFHKQEKLKSRKTIDRLFSEGRSFTVPPVKVIYLQIEGLENHMAGFSVPKKQFKKAVDRNRLKRQMREVYRNNKHLLKSNNGSKFALMFLYINQEKATFESIQNAVTSLLNKLSS
jgi:ribonuclease P protein component